MATAVRQQADVVGRIPPAAFPLETEAGQPCNVLGWLRKRGGATREWPGWCRWAGQRYPVRLVAAKRDPTAPPLAVAGWLWRITTLDAATWTMAEGLYVYRARWQVELVLKKMPQRLRLNQRRSTHRTSVEATVRALLIAWAWHASTTTWRRTLLRATASPESVVVSREVLSGLGLETLRQQVQGRWSEARLQACLPRLHRFPCSRPRRRGGQESTVRTWLEQRACARPDRRPKAAWPPS